MSSETSTEAHSFRPWHLFVLAGLLASTGAVLVVRPDDVVVLLLLVAAIGSAAAVGLAVFRTLQPLASAEPPASIPQVGGQARAAVEREKSHVLRAIKELEFDRAMGKVSDADFEEMGRRLRRQAVGLMRQLDRDLPGYRDQILKELAQRLEVDVAELEADTRPVPEPSASGARVCPDCDTSNESDARFCKGCGAALETVA